MSDLAKQYETNGILWETPQSLDKWARDAAECPEILCSFVGKVIAYGMLYDSEKIKDFSYRFKLKLEGNSDGDWGYPENIDRLFTNLAISAYEVAEDNYDRRNDV